MAGGSYVAKTEVRGFVYCYMQVMLESAYDSHSIFTFRLLPRTLHNYESLPEGLLLVEILTSHSSERGLTE